MSIQTQESFIKSVKEAEPILTDIGLSHLSTTKKGYATYINYKTTDTLLTFMLGSSDWNVEILLKLNERNFALKDLIQIPTIAKWIKENKFQQRTNDRIKNELFWLLDLLKFVFETRAWTS